MRCDTRRDYEKRIAALESLLASAEERFVRAKSQHESADQAYHRLRENRRQGEAAREWAIEQAIRAGQHHDIVGAAKKIADYVYGTYNPEVNNADSEDETS